MNAYDSRALSFSAILLAVVHDATARLRTRARSVVLLEHAPRTYRPGDGHFEWTYRHTGIFTFGFGSKRLRYIGV